MSRVAVMGVIAALLFVGFCCPPPALAFERQPVVKVCPITGQKCETKDADCDPPPPQLATSASTPIKVITPDVDTLPPAPELAPPQQSRLATASYWSAPTRTIVLRI